MKRVVVLAAVVGMCVGSVGARRLRVPRGHRNDAPKTLADQEKENQARQQKQQQQQAKSQQQQQPGPTTAPTTALAKAQVALEQVERRLWAGFEKGEDYMKAEQGLKGAQDKYDAAYKAMVVKLGERPEYAAAVARQREAEEKLKGGAGGAGAAAGLAREAMEARKAVHQMEAEAAEKDEGVKEAKGKVAEAKGVVDGLRKGFAETIKTDPDYVAAEKAVEDAKGQVGKKA